MRRSSSLALVAALSVALLAAGAAFAVTDAQVARGAAVFEQSCATCHGSSGNDGFATPLLGPGTLVRFASTRELYDYTSATMPLAAEGSLTERQYLDVTAWLLAARGRAPGAAACRSHDRANCRARVDGYPSRDAHAGDNANRDAGPAAVADDLRRSE